MMRGVIGLAVMGMFATGMPVTAYDAKVMSSPLGMYEFRVGHALDIVVEGFTKK